jgi:predicted membrane channel-forming protein YqfA (hemolysin III family)
MSTANRAPRWLPSVSLVLGSGVLGYAWTFYTDLVRIPETPWHYWLRLVFIILMGLLCLLAAVISVLGVRKRAMRIFAAALSMIPIILLTNLVILVFRVIQSFIQGNAVPFITRLYDRPLSRVILGIVIILVVLSIIQRIIYREPTPSDE